MLLDRDEFVVTYDPAKVSEATLIAIIKRVGYTAQIVSGTNSDLEPEEKFVLPQGFPLLDAALAKAQKENKPLVIDLFASWCLPCQRMEQNTFSDATVKALLEKCVFLRVDTDQQPALAKEVGVVGLPDVRLVTPDGRVVRKLHGYLSAEAFAKDLTWLLGEVKNR